MTHPHHATPHSAAALARLEIGATGVIVVRLKPLPVLVDPKGRWVWHPRGVPSDDNWTVSWWGNESSMMQPYCPYKPGDVVDDLRVKSVACKRLQEVTDHEAELYGCDCRSDIAWGRYGAYGPTMPDTAVANGHRADFERLYVETHGPVAWSANSWHWFITGEKCNNVKGTT